MITVWMKEHFIPTIPITSVLFMTLNSWGMGNAAHVPHVKDCTTAQFLNTSQTDITPAQDEGCMAIVEEASLADSLVRSLIDNFWGASFKGYEHRYFFNKTSMLADLSTGDYWPQAHSIDVITDAYLRTSNEWYRSFFAKWFAGMPRFNFSGREEDPWWNVYVDDMEWHTLALLRIYEATGETQYLNKARQMFDDWIWTQWSDKDEVPWHGGITWKTDITPSKNACSNAPAAIIAARLARYENDKTIRLSEAQQIFDWLRTYLYNPTDGAVYDHMEKDGKIVKWTFTYNQGTFLGAAHELYKLTGNQKYLSDAIQAANYVINQMSKNGGVPSDATEGDGALFHGIFFRYLANLILEPDLDATTRQTFTNYMFHCADVMTREGINHETMLYGGRWHEPTPANVPVALNAHLTACMLIEAVNRIQNRHQ